MFLDVFVDNYLVCFSRFFVVVCYLVCGTW